MWKRLWKVIYDRIDVENSSVERFIERGSRHAQPGALVLDTGAGWGRFRPLFRHCRYIAQDLCTVAEWNYGHISVVSDLQHLPFYDNTFDLVISTQVLEHVKDPAQAIIEMHRVLKPGGSLLLTLPQGWKEHQAPHDYFRFARYGLITLLDQARFHSYTVDARGGYFWFFGHVLRELLFLDCFAPRAWWARLIIWPVKWGLYGLISGIRLVCFYLDRLDRQQLLTLGYQCTATK